MHCDVHDVSNNTFSTLQIYQRISTSTDGNSSSSNSTQGTIVSFLFDLGSGCLRKGKRCVVREDACVTSLSARAWASREAPDPTLLVSAGCDALLLYRSVSTYGFSYTVLLLP